jgi:hypothetical protein
LQDNGKIINWETSDFQGYELALKW